jgi:hypothetical protein
VVVLVLGVAAVAVGIVLHAGAASPGASSRDAARAPSPEQCARPYAEWSPWNTPLVDPFYDSSLGRRLGGLQDPLTSDPTQYTYPVYTVSASTPRRKVRIDGTYSDVGDGGRSLRLRRRSTVTLPVPPDASAAAGSDAQIILADASTGDEWGAWRFDASGSTARARNAYHYNTRWTGVPPHAASGDPFGSRGAGVPYLAGLVRPCEIRSGSIRHALAFAYPYPSPAYVYPATKSDGIGSRDALPEGTRLQLDPTLTTDNLRARGCDDECLTIARALQRYGMYVIDNGGRPKLMMEYEQTAHWDGLVGADTASPIPLADFEPVLNTAPSVRALPGAGRRGRPVGLRYTVFDGGDATREALTIVVAGKTVASLHRPFHVSRSREPTTRRVRAPNVAGTVSFCVRAWDPAGHASRRSCSALRLR